jgi:hypothetical protein
MANLESEVRKAKLKIQLRPWHVPLIFIVLFLFVSLLYLFLQWYGFNTLIGNFGKELAFLSSPFNMLEDFSGYYSGLYQSPQQGYIYNTVFTTAFLFFAAFYYHFITENKRFSIERVFLGSIVGSYVVSIVVWMLTGWPSTGTSIIGFCVLAYLLGLSSYDLLVVKRKEPQLRFKTAKSIMIIPTIIFSSIILLFGYLLGNNASVYHLAGGAICGILAFTISARRFREVTKQKELRKEGAKRPDLLLILHG